MYNWRDKFGNNFVNNEGVGKDAMVQKNEETRGAYQASVSGNYGEFTVSSVLKSLPANYTVMDNILLQTGTMLRPYHPEKYGQSVWEVKAVKGKPGKLYEVVKQSTQVDHVIVSEFGVFVIETKNHKGMVFGDINGKVWTQVLVGSKGPRAYGGHDHYTFYNPVTQNLGHIKALSEALHLNQAYMTGMVVFTNPDASLGNVNCNCCYTLNGLYEAITKYNKVVFTWDKTLDLVNKLDKLNSNSYLLAKEHERYVKDLQHHKDIDIMLKRKHE